MGRFKTLIPELVSLEYAGNALPGFYLASDFSFFKAADRQLPHHFSIREETFDVPAEWDFRNGYFFKHDAAWYYHRKLGPLELALRYEPSRRAFSFSPSYRHLPFQIGGIEPIGKHIADMINLELMLSGIFILKGCAYREKNLVKAILVPSFNGKTTLLKDALQRGAEYFAEDMIGLNVSNSLLYPTVPSRTNFGRRINRQMHIRIAGRIVRQPQQAGELAFYSHSTGSSDPVSQSPSAYLHLLGLRMLESQLVKSYIFAEHLGAAVKAREHEFNHSELAIEVRQAKNYRYDSPGSTLENYWTSQGGTYAEAWTSPAKRWLSDQETSFIAHCPLPEGSVALDVGVGTGRIMNILLQNQRIAALYGVDISSEMVSICQEKFAGAPRIKRIKRHDIATNQNPYLEQYNLITAIRSLNYSSTWPDIIAGLASTLEPGSHLIFTVLNRHSVNIFARHDVPYYKTTHREVAKALRRAGLEAVEYKTFSRLPDVFFNRATSPFAVGTLIAAERLLAAIFGRRRFGRVLFVLAQKPVVASKVEVSHV